MTCLKPNGGCTPVGDCPDCDSGGTDPVLPKCQDVSLTPGTFTYATIVVNADGCVSQIQNGTAPVYTPDDCCGDGSGGTGVPGPRGPKGDTGAAATVAVDPVIANNTGTSWTVQNIGTSSNAIFQFTAPADDPTDCCPSGITANVCGMSVVDGQVKTMPASLVTSLASQALGEFASQIQLSVGINTAITDTCGLMISINLDAFYYKIKQYVDNELIQIQQNLDASTSGVRINGSLAYNTSSSDKIIEVKSSIGGTTVATLTVPAGGSVILPSTSGATYYVYYNSALVGAYTS